MRLYHALLVTAVALLVSNASAGAVECTMSPGEIVESSSGSVPKDSFEGFDSSNDSPVQQGSTTSSDVGASSSQVSSASGSAPKDSFEGFDSSNDSPVQQGSTTSSDVGASSSQVSSASGSAPKDSFEGFDSSNDSPVQQGSTTSSDVGASSSQVSSASGSAPKDSFEGFDSSNDSPVQQGSTTSSDVGASSSQVSSASGSAPKDSFEGFDSSNDSPVQQGSTTSSDVGASSSQVSSASGSAPKDSFEGFDSSNDSPVQQGSTTSSDVGASSSQVSSASGSAPKDSFEGFDSSNDSPVQQGSTTSSDVGASSSQVSSASGSAPKDSFEGFDSSNDSPVQQGSTTSSDVGASSSQVSSASGSAPKDSFEGFDSSNDSPVQQGSAPKDSSFVSDYSGSTAEFPEYPNQDSTTASDVGASASQVSSASGSFPESPIQETPDQEAPILDDSTTSSDVGASASSSSGSTPESPIQETPDQDTPIQQDSTAASASQGSATEAPVTQDSTTNSAVDDSQASAYGDDDMKQGVVFPAGTDAPSNDEASQKTDVAGESDINFQTTEAPAATTAAPSVASVASSSSGSSASNTTATSSADNSKLCAKSRVQITDVDVGVAFENNEDEAALKVVAIAALPSGGSRIAFQSGDNVIVRELDANDKLVTSSPAVKVPLHDFADMYADEKGFVILGTRDAEGGGTLNCGNPSNLCGSAPSPAVPCYDMYMVRYDGTSETWATKLTSSSASLPPYSTSKTGEDVYMIWWYAHHGRIAFDGTNWAAYFGAAVSTSEGGCINIHQGDRMKVVSPSGAITADESSFDWGCSHSAYERITYDDRSKSYATICKTDSNNRIMPPKDWGTTIYPVDLAAANLGDIVPDTDAASKKYWATVSNGNGDNAKVHLIHFAMNAAADEDITLGGTDANERAPHLAPIGSGGMLAMWEGSSSGGDLVEGADRTIYAQVLDAKTGKGISEKMTVDKSVVGNRYQALKSYSDGSVAYLSKGKTGTSLQVVRFFGC